MKNKSSLIGAILLGGLAVISSCTGNREDNTDLVEFDFYDYDCIAQYQDSLASPLEDGEYCRVKGSGVLPKKIGDNDISMLRDSLMQLSSLILINREDARPALGDDMVLTDLKTDTVNACSLLINELTVDLVTPRLVVWKDYSYNYLCGAAHGTYSTSYVNYSITESRILSMNDLFTDGYRDQLLEILRSKLEGMKVDLLVSYDEINIPDDFRITTHSIEFIYPLYEIAPYSEGEISVDIERYELEDIFRPGIEKLIFGDWDN